MMESVKSWLMGLFLVLGSVTIQGQDWNIQTQVAGDGQSASLEIQTIPQGVRVVIDQVYMGNTPLTLTNQKPRNIYIVLERDGLRTKEGKLTIPPGRKLILTAPMEKAMGNLEIQGAPEGVIIRSPQLPRYYGEYKNIPVGKYSIVLKTFGFQDQVETVTIKDKETTVVKFSAIPLEENKLTGKLPRETILVQAPPSLRMVNVTISALKPEAFILRIIDPETKAAVWESKHEILGWTNTYELLDVSTLTLRQEIKDYNVQILIGDKVIQELSFKVDPFTAFHIRGTGTGPGGLLFVSDGLVNPEGKLAGEYLIYSNWNGENFRAQFQGGLLIGFPGSWDFGYNCSYFFNQVPGELGISADISASKFLIGDPQSSWGLNIHGTFNWAWCTPLGGTQGQVLFIGPPLGAKAGLGLEFPITKGLGFLTSADLVYGPTREAWIFQPRGLAGLGLRWAQDWGVLGLSGQIFTNDLTASLKFNDWKAGLELSLYDKGFNGSLRFAATTGMTEEKLSVGVGLGMGYY